MKESLINSFPNFYDYHIEKLRNPKDAKRYLEIALEDYQQDHDAEGLMLAIMDVEVAQGGFFGFQRLVQEQFGKKTKRKPVVKQAQQPTASA